jgi:predicted secreted protein
MDSFKVMIFILTLFFLTCDANAQQPPDNTAPSKTTPKILTMEDNGKEVDLSVGGTIKVELKDIGTTGYAWYTDKLDASRLKLINEEMADIVPENPERGPAAGAPKLKIWTFKAVAPGDTSLRLLQYRVWEGKEHAINKFEVKLHITDK